MASFRNSLILTVLILTIVCHSCLSLDELRTDREEDEDEDEGTFIGLGGGGDGDDDDDDDYAPAPAPSPEIEADCAPPPPPRPPICPTTPPPSPPPPPPPICPPPPPTPSPPPPPHRPKPPPSPPPPVKSPPPPSKPPSSPPPPPSPRPPPPPKSPPFNGFPSELVERDYKTIREFKKRIKCDPMKITQQWEGKEVCKYPGFGCAKRPDNGKTAVAAADFNKFGFCGYNDDLRLTDFLEKLTDLALIHVNSNNFTGPIPDNIGVDKINFLYEFDISNNKYTGGFPTPVLAAKNLTFLDVRFNSFSGSVPREVFELDLDVLFINNNKFSQNLPDNLGSTPAIYLTLANNRFTGEIPKSIGNAKNLLETLLLGNNLTGCLPYEIGLLTNTTLFDASCNSLTGPIPYSFACLAKMQILNFRSNQLYGPVPEILCKLPNLSNLTLSENYFTEVGPECRKLIRLKRLDVRLNCILDLPEQRSAGDCAQFFSKPRHCPDEKSMVHIPCRNMWYLDLPEGSPEYHEMKQESMAPAQAPRSYGALVPNHKL